LQIDGHDLRLLMDGHDSFILLFYFHQSRYLMTDPSQGVRLLAINSCASFFFFFFFIMVDHFFPMALLAHPVTRPLIQSRNHFSQRYDALDE
jgi:hypothetical protein